MNRNELEEVEPVLAARRTAPLLVESRRTLLLAVPIMAGQLSQMLMGLLDSAMVGRVGVLPLAAAAFAINLIHIPLVCGMGLISCISVRVAQLAGAGKSEETGEYLRHGLVLSLIASAVLVFALWLVSFHLHRFGQPAAVANEARGFLLLVGVSIVPLMLAISLKQFSEALNHPWPPTIILLVSVPFNGLLNWILIYGNLGAPKLGLEGAGWATLIARVVSLLAIFWYVLCARRFAGMLPAGWLSRLHWASLRSLLKIGLPVAFHLLTEVGAFAFASIMIGWISAPALAAHQIAITCAATSFMLPLGISIAATIRVGQAIGAGDCEGVKVIGLTSYGLTLAVMTCMAMLFAFCGGPISSLFINDPGVATLSTQLLIVAAAFQWFDGLQVVGAGVLRGLSDVNYPMIVSILAYWLVALPIGYSAAFHFHLGAVGVWIGLAVGLGVVGVVLLLRFRQKLRLLLQE